MNYQEPEIPRATEELSQVGSKLATTGDYPDVTELQELADHFVSLISAAGVTWDDLARHAAALEKNGLYEGVGEDSEKLHYIFEHTLDPDYLAAAHALQRHVNAPIQSVRMHRHITLSSTAGFHDAEEPPY